MTTRTHAHAGACMRVIQKSCIYLHVAVIITFHVKSHTDSVSKCKKNQHLGERVMMERMFRLVTSLVLYLTQSGHCENMGFRVEKLFCFEARKGVIILAIIGLILSAFLAGAGLFFLCVLPYVEEAQKSGSNHDNNDLISTLARQMEGNSLPTLRSFFGACLGMGLAGIIVKASLLFGALKYRHLYMLPWLVFSMITLIIQLLTAFEKTFLFVGDFHDQVVGFLFRIVWIAVGYYYWIVTYSVYMDIKEGKFEQGKSLVEDVEENEKC